LLVVSCELGLIEVTGLICDSQQINLINQSTSYPFNLSALSLEPLAFPFAFCLSPFLFLKFYNKYKYNNFFDLAYTRIVALSHNVSYIKNFIEN